MDNNFNESKRNLSRAPQETELGSVPVNQWHSPYKKQVRNLEFQLTSVSRGRVRPPLGEQGAESIHAAINNITPSYLNIPDRVARLRGVMLEHHRQVCPELVACQPAIKKRKM